MGSYSESKQHRREGRKDELVLWTRGVMIVLRMAESSTSSSFYIHHSFVHAPTRRLKQSLRLRNEVACRHCLSIAAAYWAAISKNGATRNDSILRFTPLIDGALDFWTTALDPTGGPWLNVRYIQRPLRSRLQRASSTRFAKE